MQGSGDSPSFDSVWEVRLFGRLEGDFRGYEALRFGGTRAGALFAYLALNPQRTFSREVLAERFWPNSEPTVQRTRLRQELAVLKSALNRIDSRGEELLHIARTEIGLSTDLLITDVASFDRLVNRARNANTPDRVSLLKEVITLYRDDLLTEYPDEFTGERLALSLRFEQTLQDLATAQKEQKDYSAAIETLDRLQARGGVVEEIYLERMRLYALLGQPMMVQRQFDALERALREEQDAEPSTEVKRLFQELRRNHPTAPVEVSTPTAVPAVPSSLSAAPTETSWHEGTGDRLPHPLMPPARNPHRQSLLVPGVILLIGIVIGISLLATVGMKRDSGAESGSQPSPPAIPTVQTGKETWVYRYQPVPGEKTNSEARAIGTDVSGCRYVTGLIDTDREDSDILTLKLSPDGELLWKDRYSSPEHDCDRAFSLVMEGNDNFYVAGETYVPNGPKEGWYLTLIRYRADGKRLWVRRSPVPVKNESYRVKALLAPDNGVYLAGTALEGKTRKVLLLRYDAAGNLLWKRVLAAGNKKETVFRDMATDENGSVYLCGWAEVEGSGEGVDTDWLTTCFDANGKRKWMELSGGPVKGADHAVNIAIDRFGNVYVGGNVYTGDPGSGGQGTNLALIAYDRNGKTLWRRQNSASGPDVSLMAMNVNRYGGSPIIMVGRKVTPENNSAAFVVNYAAGGNLRWERVQPLPPGYHGSVINTVGISIGGEILALGEVFKRPADAHMQSGDFFTATYTPDGNPHQQWLYDNGTDRANALVETAHGMTLVGQSGSETERSLTVVHYAP